MRWLALALLAPAAWAQGVPFDRTAIAMLPGIEAPLRNRLNQIHGATMKEVGRVQKRLGQIDAQLEKKPTKALQAERATLQGRVSELYRQLERRTREAGLGEEQIERLERMPRGVLREERYNHGVLLEVEGLSDDQRALLEILVTSADAAEAAITAQKEHLVRGLGKEDKALRRQLASTCDQQCREIERRFWRAAYYALTPDQMRASHNLERLAKSLLKQGMSKKAALRHLTWPIGWPERPSLPSTAAHWSARWRRPSPWPRPVA